ncbi:hypothetical protein D9619_003464 [Psilocybe cf. subviscida]|uniref:Uncharacterized protein n=1 Tax=Psilocybe cf. subviscida TaxID=2480587 RepID=A0A8H5ETT4_9AGAR|nr:hypothetical protein D9619_003464 [Psilocybe cf. subviscida]
MLLSARYFAAIALFLLTSTAAAAPVPESNNVARSTELNEVARGPPGRPWRREEIEARASGNNRDWKRGEVEARASGNNRDWKREGEVEARASGNNRDWKRGEVEARASAEQDWRRASGGGEGPDWKREGEVEARASAEQDWRRASGGDEGPDW